MRKRQLYIAAGIIAAVAIAATAIFAVISTLGGNSSDANLNADVTANVELGDGNDLSSHGMSSGNMVIDQTQDNQNDDAANTTANGNTSNNDNEGNVTDIADNANTDLSYDPYIDAMRVDMSDVPLEERKGNDYLDRDRMRETIETVVPILFDTTSPLQRKQALNDYIDWSYVNSDESSYGIYYDLVYNNGAGGGLIPENATFVKMGDVTIDNANRESAVCRCDVTYSYEFVGDGGESGGKGEKQTVTATQTVQISLSGDYKVRDMKFV